MPGHVNYHDEKWQWWWNWWFWFQYQIWHEKTIFFSRTKYDRNCQFACEMWNVLLKWYFSRFFCHAPQQEWQRDELRVRNFFLFWELNFNFFSGTRIVSSNIYGISLMYYLCLRYDQIENRKDSACKFYNSVSEIFSDLNIISKKYSIFHKS